MNGYVAFYKGRRIEVEAESSYRAQLQAIEILREENPRRLVEAGLLAVVLTEKGGKQVTHAPLF